MNVAIIQSRYDSNRLPGKALARVYEGISLLDAVVQRVQRSRYIDRIIIATSDEDSDDIISNHCRDKAYECFRGSKNNVLERFVKCAQMAQADAVVRITGDNPLIDPLLIDRCIIGFRESGVDFFSNTRPRSFPDGQDVAIMRYDCLKAALENAKTAYEKEHVTPWLRESNHVSKKALLNDVDLSHLRMTVDYAQDLENVRYIISEFQGALDFTWQEACTVMLERQEGIKREDLVMQRRSRKIDFTQNGQALWGRAKRVIPGGNMLLSKRPEMFLPGLWPSYFQSANGCEVKDVDGNQYIDMSIMGIGTNTLGYGNKFVDERVREVITNGNSSTLNCPEEVMLAEALVEMHPWSDMVRFARTGGEANAIAIRLARAVTHRERILVCGYHGWHDWYLSINLNREDGLSDHLLPGLSPVGVADSLKGSVDCFQYNDINKVKDLFNSGPPIAAVIMEPKRNIEPEREFLAEVRKICSSFGAVLIFDECTSGFRETFGGLHLKYGVDPDLAMFGKALGNGYAITAVLGRREVMQCAQKSFISSTFWTERTGPAAGLATLEEMRSQVSWIKITEAGKIIQKGLQTAASSANLKIEIFGIPSLTKFRFPDRDNRVCKTYITQEMLKLGYLAGNSIYVCTAHTPLIVSRYLDAVEVVFQDIAAKSDTDLKSDLQSDVCHIGFERLN